MLTSDRVDRNYKNDNNMYHDHTLIFHYHQLGSFFLTGHKAASKLDQATNQDRHLDDHDDNDYTHDDYEAEEGGDDEDKYGNYHDHGDDDYYHYDDL